MFIKPFSLLKKYKDKSYVGLISVSDIIKSKKIIDYDNYYSMDWSWMGIAGVDEAFGILTSCETGGLLYCNIFDIHAGTIIGGRPANDSYYVKPSVYLKSTVKLDGNGTQEEPYKIIN